MDVCLVGLAREEAGIKSKAELTGRDMLKVSQPMCNTVNSVLIKCAVKRFCPTPYQWWGSEVGKFAQLKQLCPHENLFCHTANCCGLERI